MIFGATYVLEEHGAEKHRNVTRKLFIPSGCYSGATSIYFCTAAVIFPDGADHYSAHSFKVPDDFLSLSSLKVLWAGEGGVAGQDWVSELYATYKKIGESMWLHDEGPTPKTIDVTVLDTLYATDFGFSLLGLENGHYISVELARHGLDGSDTYTGKVHVFGILFTYTAKQ